MEYKLNFKKIQLKNSELKMQGIYMLTLSTFFLIQMKKKIVLIQIM